MSFFEDDVEQATVSPAPKLTAKPKSKETLDIEFREKSEINSLWVEKYRPQKLEEYIGNDALKKRIGLYISSGDIPHILLSGPPGTGKCLDFSEYIDIEIDVNENEEILLKKWII